MEELFVNLLQVTLGNKACLRRTPSDKEWYEIFSLCMKQSIAAFVFTALERMSEAEHKPPVSLLYEWIGLSEQVKKQNVLMNQEAARLTHLFEGTGHQTAILKGQANARLYPQPWSRQPGDIDIWVDGGREAVVEMLGEMGLIGDIATCLKDGQKVVSYHHIDLRENGIKVEVHFRPSSGNYYPLTNRRLQSYLENEIHQENELVSDGFRVPGMAFALVMQLAHIQRHFIGEGIGMRQIIDYYYLLKSDVRNQRDDIFYRLKSLGLSHIAEALMWVLHEKLLLEEEYLIAPMDEKRGKMLYRAIMEGGNFGHHYPGIRGSWQRVAAKHKRRFQMMNFNASEVIGIELKSVYYFFSRIPERIQRRTWSLE